MFSPRRRPFQLPIKSTKNLLYYEADPSNLAFEVTRSFSGRKLNPRVRTIADLSSRASDGLVPDIAFPFNGTLLRRDVIERIGTVAPRMFIWGEEIDFMTRAMQRGYRIATVLSAIMQHPRFESAQKAHPFFGQVAIPEQRRAHITFRNSGWLDRVRGRRFRAFLGCLRRSFAFCTVGEWRLAARLPAYYIDGYCGTFRLPPSQRVLDARYTIQRLRLFETAASWVPQSDLRLQLASRHNPQS